MNLFVGIDWLEELPPGGAAIAAVRQRWTDSDGDFDFLFLFFFYSSFLRVGSR